MSAPLKLLLQRTTPAELSEIVARNKNAALLCSPYISRSALDAIYEALTLVGTIDFYTRFDLQSWISGTLDPEALLLFADKIISDGKALQIWDVRYLHAKVYGGEHKLLVGSANLTTSAFSRNVEINVVMSGEIAKLALTRVRLILDGSDAVEISRQSLADWVEKNKEGVLSIRAAISAIPSGPANRPAGKLIRKAFPAPTAETLAAFLEWLDRNVSGFPGAVLLHGHGLGFQQRSGHFRQTVLIAYRFLADNQRFLDDLAHAALSAPDGLYDFNSPAVLNAWKIYLADRRAEETADYSFRTLRRILPKSLGGSLLVGGGASGTLRRALPLVAAYMLKS